MGKCSMGGVSVAFVLWEEVEWSAAKGVGGGVMHIPLHPLAFIPLHANIN